MSQSMDLTQISIEHLLKCLGRFPKDADQQRKLKADATQCAQTFLLALFFIIWYSIDGEAKYSNRAFLFSLMVWLLYSFQIVCIQYHYIIGLRNDWSFRITWGKIIDLIQNLILLIYFCSSNIKDDSLMNFTFFIFLIINFSLDIIELIRMIYIKEFECLLIALEQQHREGGLILFLDFALIGQILTFIGLYFQSINEYQNLEDQKQIPLQSIWRHQMIGNVVIAFFVIFRIIRSYRKQFKDIQKQRKILMMVQGLIFGMSCIFVSYLVSIVLIMYMIMSFINACLSKLKSQVNPFNETNQSNLQ